METKRLEESTKEKLLKIMMEVCMLRQFEDGQQVGSKSGQTAMKSGGGMRSRNIPVLSPGELILA